MTCGFLSSPPWVLTLFNLRTIARHSVTKADLSANQRIVILYFSFKELKYLIPLLALLMYCTQKMQWISEVCFESLGWNICLGLNPRLGVLGKERNLFLPWERGRGRARATLRKQALPVTKLHIADAIDSLLFLQNHLGTCQALLKVICVN